MKKKYVKIMFLSLSLLTISTTATYAVQPEDDKKENEALQTSTEEHLPLLTINGTNASSSFIVNSEALLGKEITITAPNGFTVTPTVIAANSGKQKVKVTLNSTKRLTEGKIILRSGDIRSYIKVKGFGTALPVKMCIRDSNNRLWSLSRWRHWQLKDLIWQAEADPRCV